MSVIILTPSDVAICWKVQIQPAVASNSTDGNNCYMYKSFKKTKCVRRCMESLALHAGAPTVYWKYNTSCISSVEANRVTPRFKHINILVCCLQDQYDYALFIPKCDKSAIMPADMCTKP